MSSIQDAAAETNARMSERGLARAIIGSMLVGLVILASTVIAAGWLLLRAQDFNGWVDHTYTVETQIAQFQVLLERAEAARRGYLISGEERYRVVFGQATRDVGPLIASLRRLTADNPVERARLDRLEPEFKAKMDYLEASMRQREVMGVAAGIEGFRRSGDQATLDNLRRMAADMTVEEHRLLAERSARATANVELLLWVIVLAGVLLALVAAASTWVMRRYSLDLAASETKLRRVNEGLESAVRARTADLTRANQEIQRFAYIVSHDLRSPLVNIMGFTSELEAASKPLNKLVAAVTERSPEILTEDARVAVETDLPKSIGFIRSSTQKMDRLITAILKLSREGRRSLTPEPLEMDALVDAILRSMHRQIDDRGADVTIEGALPDMVSDRVAVEQVLSNLIENALKYLKPGRPGVIVVRGHAEGPRLIYEVQDNGRGVDPKDQERIFELFRRAGPQDQPGEGIGLAHVRALVYRLGGLITCVSALDQGASFRVSLPRVLVREESPQP